MRKTIKITLLVCMVALVFTACIKTEIVVIDNNQAPIDVTVPNVLKENYVQKCYLALLGRVPTSAEYDTGFAIISKNNCSVDNRLAFLDTIHLNKDYYNRAYDIENTSLLRNATDNEIDREIRYWNTILADTSRAKDHYIALRYLEWTRLLKNAKGEFTAKLINFRQLQRRMILNGIFTNIHGTHRDWASFVFEYLFLRLTTNEESDFCKQFWDGFSTNIFGVEGNSAEDLADILVDCNEYYEGQVRTLYLRYLFREPTSTELLSDMQFYQGNKDYFALQKRILSTNEYLGLK